MKIKLETLLTLVEERAAEIVAGKSKRDSRVRARILAEANVADKPLIGDSLDAQVDKKFIQFEREAKHQQNESFSYRTLAYHFLTEAGEKDDEEEDAGGELGGESGAQGTIDDIDLDEFAYTVANLIENADTLLEFRDTLVKRAMNHLAKSYDRATVKQFSRILAQNYDMRVGKTKSDKEHDIVPPPAVGAGPTGA